MMPRLLAAAALLVAAGAARGVAAADAKVEESFRYDSKGHRDPFVPLVRDGRMVGSQAPTRIEESKPVLYGILWDPGGHSIALINDTEVKVGDKIGEFKVTEIQRNSVVLDLGGQPVVLEIAFDTPAAPRSKAP